MTCFIIDDDGTTRFLIEDMVSKISHLKLIGSFDSPLTAMKEYVEKKPDLILLDVEMPDISGVEFASGLEKDTKVIFISSKKEYAVDAFGLNAVDYILKPVTLPRLTKAILKIEKEKGLDNEDHFYIKTSDGYNRVEIVNITYVEALGDYVQIYTINGKYIMNGTLKNALSKLPVDKFLRVHRSFIVNMKRIEKLEDNTIIIGKKVIPIGRSYKKEFSERINTLDL